MHHCIRSRAGKRELNLLAVGQITFDESRPRIHSAAMAFAKIIENRNLMAFIKKQFCADAPDVSGTANDENFHALGKFDAPRVKSKRPEKSSLLRDSFPSFFLKIGDHLPHAMVFAARREHLQALFLRSPLQNIDIDVAHTPTMHVEAARLVKVDRFGSHERSAVIVNYVFFVCSGNSKPRPEWKTRPIGRGATNEEYIIDDY